MDLIGMHINTAPYWPVSINIHNAPKTSIPIKTCNRIQILSERKDSKKVLELFTEQNLKPEVYSDKKCVDKLFTIALGLDSVIMGNKLIRTQLYDAKSKSGTNELKKIMNDILFICEEITPIVYKSEIERCLYFFTCSLNKSFASCLSVSPTTIVVLISSTNLFCFTFASCKSRC
ncbi:MAG: hypothetical protein EBS55_12480 [Flavobacteriaceae bacterium]|nr:hypothetical protein [Flavobacteriaceae bacterium]